MVDLRRKDCSCLLFRGTSECPHLLAMLQHSGAQQLVPPIIKKKSAGTSRGRGRGRARGRGWMNPAESVSSDVP